MSPIRSTEQALSRRRRCREGRRCCQALTVFFLRRGLNVMSLGADHAAQRPSILVMPWTGIFHMPLTGICCALPVCVGKQCWPFVPGSGTRDDNRHTLWLKPEGELDESATADLNFFAKTVAVLCTVVATATSQAVRTVCCGPATATGGVLWGPLSLEDL